MKNCDAPRLVSATQVLPAFSFAGSVCAPTKFLFQHGAPPNAAQVVGCLAKGFLQLKRCSKLQSVASRYPASRFQSSESCVQLELRQT